jgi:hypothetical protein
MESLAFNEEKHENLGNIGGQNLVKALIVSPISFLLGGSI